MEPRLVGVGIDKGQGMGAYRVKQISILPDANYS